MPERDNFLIKLFSIFSEKNKASVWFSWRKLCPSVRDWIQQKLILHIWE